MVIFCKNLGLVYAESMTKAQQGSRIDEINRNFLWFCLRFRTNFGGVSKSMLTLNEAIIDVKEG